MKITVKERGHNGFAIATDNGVRMGESTYSMAGDKLIIIDHTEVSDAARGKGVGRALLDAIVEMAREKGKRIMPLCPFAKSQFDKDDGLRDVLYK